MSLRLPLSSLPANSALNIVGSVVPILSVALGSSPSSSKKTIFLLLTLSIEAFLPLPFVSGFAIVIGNTLRIFSALLYFKIFVFAVEVTV